MFMPKIGVMLSGCGVFDGSEINEAVLSVYFLEKNGAEVLFLAPDNEQLHVVNHLNEQVSESESRNVLIESARIARGKIKKLEEVEISELDGLFIPGGFGAAKNLCTFALDGPNCKINENVKKLILNTVMAVKPLCAICIAPVLVAKALESSGKHVKLTIGNDKNIAEAIEMMGAIHINSSVSEAVCDKENKIVSTPAYMLGQGLLEVAEGISKAVKEFMGLL
jgi:enhancing lycopene biosynthesis protein 2